MGFLVSKNFTTKSAGVFGSKSPRPGGFGGGVKSILVPGVGCRVSIWGVTLRVMVKVGLELGRGLGLPPSEGSPMSRRDILKKDLPLMRIRCFFFWGGGVRAYGGKVQGAGCVGCRMRV